MVSGVKALGLETCVTLGMLDTDQARRLKQPAWTIQSQSRYLAEFYVRSSPPHLPGPARYAGQRARRGHQRLFAAASSAWASRAATGHRCWRHWPICRNIRRASINQLVQVEGTPLYGCRTHDPFDFVRTIAVARITMPRLTRALVGGRDDMSDELQALCFPAGANSIFLRRGNY